MKMLLPDIMIDGLDAGYVVFGDYDKKYISQ